MNRCVCPEDGFYIKDDCPVHRLSARMRYRQNPELKARYKARAIATKMTADGTLKQRPCAFCQEEQTQKHHPDYNEPLLIVWLCAKCHKELHTSQKNK